MNRKSLNMRQIYHGRRCLLQVIEMLGGYPALAQALNISRQQLSSWMNGEHRKTGIRHCPISSRYVTAIVKLSKGLLDPADLRPDIFPPKK